MSSYHQLYWMLTNSGQTLATILEDMSSRWTTWSMEFSEVGMEYVNFVMGMRCRQIKLLYYHYWILSNNTQCVVNSLVSYCLLSCWQPVQRYVLLECLKEISNTFYVCVSVCVCVCESAYMCVCVCVCVCV